jgi:hypothetical protein
MPLSAGTLLGPYEILAPLGAVEQSGTVPITVVVNWTAGLKK